VPRITVHLALSDNELEKAMLSLLGRNARFLVVKGSIGYAAESDVRLVDESPDPDQQRELDELSPPKLLFIGLGRSEQFLLDAAHAGAWAYISESADADELEDAICSLVESKGSPLLKQLAQSDSGSFEILAGLTDPDSDDDDHAAVNNPLTTDEIKILELIARGEPSKNIGHHVGLAEQTVKNYVVKILDKTHTHNRTCSCPSLKNNSSTTQSETALP